MIKNRIALISNDSIKFNEIKICQREKALTIISISCEIELIQDHLTATSSSRDTIRFNLIIEEQYVAKRVREIYVTSICQFEITYNLFHAAQFIDLFSKDIKVLNKRLI